MQNNQGRIGDAELGSLSGATREAIRAYLPSSNYPQSPQLFGPKRNRRFKVLA
jgi:hypothetical protein